MDEDYVVTCGNCGGESLEHQITPCEECKKDVCLNCAAFAWHNPDDCICAEHPADVHKGDCYIAINGNE
jgi:hypothetical protein